MDHKTAYDIMSNVAQEKISSIAHTYSITGDVLDHVNQHSEVQRKSRHYEDAVNNFNEIDHDDVDDGFVDETAMDKVLAEKDLTIFVLSVAFAFVEGRA